VTHGGGLSEREAGNLPGDPIVVNYAPQLALLARARLTVTHAGLNTVLDSLASGVPLVTVPITYEQPAIARRVEWVGAGATVPLERLTSGNLRQAIRDVLENPNYGPAAARLKDAIARAGTTLRDTYREELT
jgi:UDP:flavonoid glycosyltransferase YjiC (YdhE family)